MNEIKQHIWNSHNVYFPERFRKRKNRFLISLGDDFFHFISSLYFF
ncbi:hypothetical protein BLGI_3347 [Brevibacillus laterosporus GI-9]|nr:hypothetical protein BLGI_3347 [Brevibacillus laterosporus GI-9]